MKLAFSAQQIVLGSVNSQLFWAIGNLNFKLSSRLWVSLEQDVGSEAAGNQLSTL